MLDQMFSAEGFRRIFDMENRRGMDVAGKYFPALGSHTEAIRDKVAQIRELRSQRDQMPQAQFEAALKNARDELKSLKETKSDAIDDLLETTSGRVMKPDFKIAIEARPGPDAPTGKEVYVIDGSAESFFVVKQLQRNLNRIYGVKQANRSDILQQVRDTLVSRFPFELVRTDISSFYESVDTKRMLDQLDDDQLLSSMSRKFIVQIVKRYQAVSGTTLGIPRGVGVSAYLAELYLRPVDRAVQALPGLVLYARYVDDIIAVFARPPVGKDIGSYKTLISDALANRGLTANPLKTEELDLGVPGPHTLNYLGYEFRVEHGQCRISPSAAKIVRYLARMDAAFRDYHLTSSISPRRSFREIVARIKFLTGNTKLSNNKASAATGIYYNNSIATDISALAKLDAKLKKHIMTIKRPKLRARLAQFTFTSGFEQRRYHNFSSRELAVIVEAWKHG